MPENTEITEKYTHAEAQKMEEKINEYIKENGFSPFKDIKLDEDTDGQMQIEMDSEFETKMEAEINDVPGALSDYFTVLITDLIENTTEEDIELFKEFQAKQEVTEAAVVSEETPKAEEHIDVCED